MFDDQVAAYQDRLLREADGSAYGDIEVCCEDCNRWEEHDARTGDGDVEEGNWGWCDEVGMICHALAPSCDEFAEVK